MASSSDILFKGTQLGALKLKNKFVVAPLTRMRSNPDDNIPNDLMVEYYSQRASFGLILTECSQISPLSNSFPGSGGIFNEAQAQGWKRVTDAVHVKGGLIMLQIWHSERATLSSQIGGKLPIAPTAVKANCRGLNSFEVYPVPHELTIPEIKEVIEDFRKGAVLAKQAGFDGVELHGANGFLVDQFLRDNSNTRTDEYGGSIENRSKFCLEVIDALISVFGNDRVAVRLSPTGRYNDMFDSNPLALMTYLLGQLSQKNLAFVEFKRHSKLDHLNPANKSKTDPSDQLPNFFEQLRALYKGNLMANDGVSIEEAIQLTNNGTAQAVSFGSLSISNPDLPLRVQHNLEINKKGDSATWFTSGPKGYTDYPFANIINKK